MLYFLAFGSTIENIGALPQQSTESIRGFSEIGIILIMFALGFEEDTQRCIKGIKRSWGIALFGAQARFAATYSLGFNFRTGHRHKKREEQRSSLLWTASTEVMPASA